MTYGEYIYVKNMIELAEKLGFTVGSDTAQLGTNHAPFAISISENPSKLPVYTRRVNVFTGDHSACFAFLIGWQKSQQYLTMVGATTDKKIAAAEQKYADKIAADRLIYAVKNLKILV